MIEMLTRFATAACDNCSGRITGYRSDLRLDPVWSHDGNGKEACPGHVAEPMAGTYNAAQSGPSVPSTEETP